MELLWTKGSSDSLAGRSAEVWDGKQKFHVMFQEVTDPPTAQALAESYAAWSTDKGAREVLVRLMHSGVEAHAYPFQITPDGVTQLEDEPEPTPEG